MKKNYRTFSMVLFFAFLLAGIAEVYAVGALFCRPRWSSEAYQKMWIKSIDAQIDIDEQIAVTRLDQVFYNELNQSAEAIFIFPLPENAVLSEMIYRVNGNRYVAEIREREDAVKEYNKKLREWLDPALLEYLGDNLFRLSIVPIDARSEVRVEITYVEPLAYEFGKVTYYFPLNTTELSSRPLETVTLNLEARSQYPFSSFRCPSHAASTAMRISAESDFHYSLFFGDENFYPDADLLVEFELQREDVTCQILTYTPAMQDSFGTDSFYALWITPPDILDEEEVIPKDMVFTVDVSSSMEGERLSQVKEALNHFLDLLKPPDRFNILAFGTFVDAFDEDLVPATSENLESAHDFVSQLYALGMTNIEGALIKSLNQSYADSTSANLIFLTDGRPTWGETNPDSILSIVRKNNQHDVRIFSFGLGQDISRAFLGDLAAQNHGFAKFIEADDSIAIVVNDHFTRISKPVLTDIEIDLGGLDSWDTYPKRLNDLYWGSQVLQLGLYKNSGTFPVVLSGKDRDEAVVYERHVTFPDTVGGHRFVPRLWARAKIDHLLYLIETYGEKDELVDQIIGLSLRFQILTPYTAFYADDEEDDDESTHIDDKKQTTPESFKVMQNYPNPFNPTTTLHYYLPADKSEYHVTVKIYNTLGQLIAVLIDGAQSPGWNKLTWDGRDDSGNPVPSGVYICRVQAERHTQYVKMILIR